MVQVRRLRLYVAAFFLPKGQGPKDTVWVLWFGVFQVSGFGVFQV